MVPMNGFRNFKVRMIASGVARRHPLPVYGVSVQPIARYYPLQSSSQWGNTKTRTRSLHDGVLLTLMFQSDTEIQACDLQCSSALTNIRCNGVAIFETTLFHSHNWFTSTSLHCTLQKLLFQFPACIRLFLFHPYVGERISGTGTTITPN
jgi:hypothetical protein